MKRKTTITLTISIIGLVLLGYLGFQKWNGASGGTIQAIDDSSTQDTVRSFDSTPRHITGTYASFSVPIAMHQVNSQAPKAPVLETFNFDYKTTVSWRLAITIQDVSLSASGYDSSYDFRVKHPEQYSRTVQEEAGKRFVVFTDTQGPGNNTVGYQTNGGRVAVIALSGGTSADQSDMQETFTMVLQTWKWLL